MVFVFGDKHAFDVAKRDSGMCEQVVADWMRGLDAYDSSEALAAQRELTSYLEYDAFPLGGEGG